jgi:hypothetical protein
MADKIGTGTQPRDAQQITIPRKFVQNQGGDSYAEQMALASGGLPVNGTNPLPVKGAKGAKTFSAAAPAGVAAPLLAANPNRISAMLVNNGSVTVFLGKANTVHQSDG